MFTDYNISFSMGTKCEQNQQHVCAWTITNTNKLVLIHQYPRDNEPWSLPNKVRYMVAKVKPASVYGRHMIKVNALMLNIPMLEIQIDQKNNDKNECKYLFPKAIQ
jgi:hypothetical protein